MLKKEEIYGMEGRERMEKGGKVNQVQSGGEGEVCCMGLEGTEWM